LAVEAGEDAQQGRLAAAARPDDAEEFARRHVQVDVVERDNGVGAVAVNLAQLRDLDRRAAPLNAHRYVSWDRPFRGASLWVMFSRIVFFGALPMIFAGLRIAVAVAFIVLVAAEFVSTKVGIGYMIWNSWELLQVDSMFVGIVVIGLLGLVASALLAELEHKVVPWKSDAN